MVSTTTSVRASRFSILPDKLPSLEVMILDFPFGEAINLFVDDMKREMSGSKDFIPVPYRRLNKLLMAICPTLTHGFEWNNERKIWQSLAVGIIILDSKTKRVLTSTCNPPSPEHLSRIIQVWGQHWTKSDVFRTWMQSSGAKDIANRFLSALREMPASFQWKTQGVAELFNHLDNVSYSAIPSLLATLLHQKTSIINGQLVTWRKVQEDDRTLSIISSPPHRANYEDDFGNVKEGYFAYKVVFSPQTQAGHTKPWIFIKVHVQRYTDERLKDKNEGRDVSILMGANQARLDDFPTDTTLVRLGTEGTVESGDWDDNLSDLLTTIGARPLLKPAEIYQNPRHYWQQDEEFLNDEFYVIHAEGYKYGEGRGHGHAVKTGYSLSEQNKIVAEILKHLPFLKPDVPLSADKPAPSGIKTPLAMRGFDYLETTPQLSPELKHQLGSEKAVQNELEKRTAERRKERQPIVQQAVERALRGEPILITILWHNPDTRDALCEALRDLFLLNPDESFPSNVMVVDCHIPRDLIEKLDYKGEGFVKARHNKMESWREFLQKQVPNTCPNRYALIELLPDTWKVKSAVREACARENISSQMKQPVRVTHIKDDTKNISRGEQAKIDNAVRDLALRQLGAMFGIPSEVYQQAGIPDDIASNLSVVAFYLKQTRGMTYPIATRLCPSGEVEVLLPHTGSQWMPYAKAGAEVGRIFAKAGSYYKDGKSWVKKDGILSLSSTQLLDFVVRVLTKELTAPTIALIEADVWRNKGTWDQLKNEILPLTSNVLDFGQKNPFGQPYQRDDKRLENLLAVIRIRSGKETPQYIPSGNAWGADKELRDLQHLSGFIEVTESGLLHYFSIGGIPTTAKGQDQKSARYTYMTDGIGAGIAFKHQQMIEFLPFFIHPRFAPIEMKMALCRVPHYLRVSPAWIMGNIIYPYPLHLAEKLIEDQLCIIGLDE